VFILICLALALGLAGCLSKPALRRQTFAFQIPPTAAPTESKGQSVLAIRSCEVAPTFASRSLAYRTGQDAYELDPYAGFLIQPAAAVEIPVRAYLRNSGAFKDVVELGGAFAPDVLLDVRVSELYGDFRSPGHAAAVLSLHLRFFTVESGRTGKTWLQKDYSRREPLKENTAAAVVAGWDQALAQIMAEAIADIGTARR
jgi:ABC-type uncharacterized transport system auxiliary subunit